MKLGIDFGTTRTVVAVADRGNYPIVQFLDEAGDAHDFLPSLVAEEGGVLHFGFDARDRLATPGASVVRSFKRLLADASASPGRLVQVGRVELPLAALVARYLAHLAEALQTSAVLPKGTRKNAVMETVIAVPASALSAQRLVTLDGFRKAGLSPRAILNEPSAAGFEFTHRHSEQVTSRREHVVVYDLGGGTFDASLVRVSERHHEVIGTSGIERLGGDDFDAVLVRLVLEEAGVPADALSPAARTRLAEQCRELKERLTPQAKRVTIDLESALGDEAPEPDVTVPTAAFYEACQPLVEQTLEALDPLLARMEEAQPGGLAGLYVVGGGSSLPVVARTLREKFGRRVHRSPYPSAATAIGLAIAADDEAGFELTDRFSRAFGVFREGDAGRTVTFDPIFTHDETLPRTGEVISTRRYRASHNVGHFRFVEAAKVIDGRPAGEILPFADVRFPFDPSLREGSAELSAVEIARGSEGPLIEERYAIDPHGIVEVRIQDVDSGYAQTYRMG